MFSLTCSPDTKEMNKYTVVVAGVDGGTGGGVAVECAGGVAGGCGVGVGSGGWGLSGGAVFEGMGVRGG